MRFIKRYSGAYVALDEVVLFTRYDHGIYVTNTSNQQFLLDASGVPDDSPLHQCQSKSAS